MSINYFNGDPMENMDAALSDEIVYPKWLATYDQQAQVWVFNESDQPPSDSEVSENNGVKIYYPYSTQE